MSQHTSLQSRGSAGEFSFAFGFNINNIVYLGASLDLMTISRKQTIYYDEYINYDGPQPDGATYPYLLRDFRYAQTMNLDGSGVGAKFGIVVRPVESLRVGFALHTPTYFSLAYGYRASLSSAAASIGSNPYGWEVINGNVYADEYTPTLGALPHLCDCLRASRTLLVHMRLSRQITNIRHIGRLSGTAYLPIRDIRDPHCRIICRVHTPFVVVSR